MQMPFDDDEERALQIEMEKRRRLTPNILQGVDKPGLPQADQEPSGPLLEALKMLYGTGSPSEPMSMRARKPKPDIEAQLQAEAKGLMEDESARKGWHAPMVDNQAMPNQARDPEAERAQRAKVKAMMGLKGPAGAPKGQDNFATPTPTAFERAKVSGAMMLPPVQPTPSTEDEVVRVSPGSYFDQSMARQQQPQPKAEAPPAMATPEPSPMSFPDFSAMGPEAPGPELSPGGEYGLDLPEMADQPVDMLSDPGPLPRDASDPRERLRAFIEGQQGPSGQMAMSARDGAMLGSMRDSGKTNSQLGLMNLMMASAKQAGTVGGKSASNDDYQRFTGGQMEQNEGSNKTFEKLALQKDKQQDDRMKGMMALARMKQDEEKYKADIGFRGKQLEDLAGYRKESLAVQRDRNALDSGYRADTLRALEGANSTKANLTDAQIKLLQQKTENLANPATLPETPLQKAQRLKLEAETKKVSEGKAPGVGKTPPGLADVDKKTAAEYTSYITKNGRSRALSGIDRLKKMADSVENDRNSTGPLISMVPDKVRSLAGNKGPDYKQSIESVIGETVKELAGGGAVSDYEAQSILARGFNPSLSPKQNATRLREIAADMEAKVGALDESMQYFQDNDFTLYGYKPGLPRKTQQSTGSGSTGSWDNAPTMRAEDL